MSNNIKQQCVMNRNEDLEQQVMSAPQIQLQSPAAEPTLLRHHKKYGNMIVFFESPFLLTLGPDYWCFLPTFFIFCTVSFLLVRFVLTNAENVYFKFATVFICGLMCLSYFLVATSNPGVVTDQDFTDSEQEENPMNQSTLSRKKLCKKCNIRVKRSTQHCHDCDVCISEYDHHCPWTSKCIGGGNLIRFYIFLGTTPVFLIYVFVAFATLMSQIAVQNATAHLKVHPH